MRSNAADQRRKINLVYKRSSNRINELALMETLLGNLLIGMRIDFVFNQFPNTDHRHRGRAA